MALVCKQFCDGSARKAEERFGWGREAVARGLLERSGQSVEKCTTIRHSTLRSEVRNPQLAVDIRLIVEPHTHTDPELKTARLSELHLDVLVMGSDARLWWGLIH